MKHHLRSPISWIILVLIIFIIILVFVIPLTKDVELKMPSGNECIVDSDCPQYRCPGVRASCIDGFCKPVDLKGEVTRCVDLRNPVCGNDVCEGDERDGRCPADCGDSYGVSKRECELAGGNWNECGSPCAGMGAEVCVAVCESHCECGGVAGFSCPKGYNCRLSGKVVDEVGVCIPS